MCRSTSSVMRAQHVLKHSMPHALLDEALLPCQDFESRRQPERRSAERSRRQPHNTAIASIEHTHILLSTSLARDPSLTIASHPQVHISTLSLDQAIAIHPFGLHLKGRISRPASTVCSYKPPGLPVQTAVDALGSGEASTTFMPSAIRAHVRNKEIPQTRNLSNLKQTEVVLSIPPSLSPAVGIAVPPQPSPSLGDGRWFQPIQQ